MFLAQLNYGQSLLFVGALWNFGFDHVEQDVTFLVDEAGLLVETLGEALEFFVVVGELSIVGFDDELRIYSGLLDASVPVFEDEFLLGLLFRCWLLLLKGKIYFKSRPCYKNEGFKTFIRISQ